MSAPMIHRNGTDKDDLFRDLRSWIAENLVTEDGTPGQMIRVFCGVRECLCWMFQNRVSTIRYVQEGPKSGGRSCRIIQADLLDEKGAVIAAVNLDRIEYKWVVQWLWDPSEKLRSETCEDGKM